MFCFWYNLINNPRIIKGEVMLELLKKSAMEQSKALKNKEMDEIQNIIQTIIDVDVDFDTPKSLGLSSIKKTFKQETIVSETTFHRGSLRSGQRLEVDGSVVILGDVNSGAEVMASDNIVILGNLRGLAHAGAKGNKQAIIAAGLFLFFSSFAI